MLYETTLANAVQATGVGLHSGKQVKLSLSPTPVGTGIVFRRTDLSPCVEIPGRAHQVGDTRLASTLVNGNVRISTVEHMMSALSGMGIDNVYIDVDAAELPIMDGSSTAFVFLIESAGLRTQETPKRFVRILKEVKVEEGDKFALLKPYEHGFKVTFEIDFNHPVIGQYPQKAELELSPMTYVHSVSRARTFGLLAEYEMLKANNLALGGSLENAIVVADDRIINEDGLRFDDEFVKHKVLDAIGDLYLLGHSILGAYHGYKSGHALNNRLLLALLADTSAWEYTHVDGHSKSKAVA